MKKAAFAALVVACAWCAPAEHTRSEGSMRRLSVEEYRDKMTAGWLGQMIGVQWGLPTEFRYQGSMIPDDKVPAWDPGMINGGFDNDDLFVEMTFLRSLEHYGLDVSSRQAGLDFANSKYALCAANWAGRDNLRRGIAPPDCGHPKFNACSDCIDYQIESDYAGLISPGLPQRVIDLSHVFGTMVNSGDGVWAGQFMGAMYAEAFFTREIGALLDAGLAAIPPDSQYAGMVRDVRQWHAENPDDWQVCWEKVKSRYIDDPKYHRGRIDQLGSDVKPNGAFVVMGLLYGGGDPVRSMKIAMQCGWDSDCNPSSVAGVLYTTLGTRSIESGFVSALDRSKKFSYSDYDFSGLIRVCERLMRENVTKGGGRIEKSADGSEWIVLPRVVPTPDACLPNWNPPAVTGARYTPEQMQLISEKPFPGIGATLRSREKLPLPPIGDGEKWMLGDHSEEYGMALIPFCFAPYDLENESLPIRICGLTNTVVHLGWGKCHVSNFQTIFAFEDCDNVILREGFVFFHAKAEQNPPPLYTTQNCGRVKVYNVHKTVIEPEVAEMAAISIKDGQVFAGEKPFVFRGINWGWWHDEGTKYTENDMRQQSEWGANMLRLPVSYRDIEDAGNLGTLSKNGIRDVDEVVSWAEKYDQYVILDMHVCPGGQNGFKYIDGGNRGIWTNESCRRRYLSLWRALAAHYRGRNVVAAYELMNEPDTQRPMPDQLTNLQNRVISEIRKIDANKVIVVSGDNFSNASSLGTANVLDARNLIYTFHFYEYGGIIGGWVRNEAEDEGVRGTDDWFQFDRRLNITAFDAELAILLRSCDNSGTVWFDDVELVDDSGNVVQKFYFDSDSERFVAERDAEAVISYDRDVGRGRPGSLRVARTRSYNGWIGPRVKLPKKNAVYRLRGWMRLENASGKNYAAAAIFGTTISTRDKLENAIRPMVEFQRQYKVPVFVGEFAVERGANGHQPKDTAWRIDLFEKYGFGWAYWNYRETSSPETMALHAQRKDGTDFPINEPLLKVLKLGWAKNKIDVNW